MITTGQAAAGTTAVLLLNVPPGVSTLILTGGLLGSYYGGSGVTNVNGAPLPAGAVVTIPVYATSKGTPLYVAATASTVVGFCISTDS